MTDGIMKGNGASRYLKTIASGLSQYPTYEDFMAALVEGTFPVDLFGRNPGGWTQEGTLLNKASLLSDETARKFGLGVHATVNDVLALTGPGLIPAGTVFWLASETLPGGFLKCDGSAVSRTLYAKLFAAIGTKFGAGDGSATFALLDLRAAFIRGAGSQSGYSATFAQKQEASYVYNTYGSSALTAQVGYADKYMTSGISGSSWANGGSGGYVRPFNLALTPIIKY